MNGMEIKISQYADDTTFILNGTQESLSAALDKIDNFGIRSGLILNDKKTEALWALEKENRVTALGVWISTDPKITLNLNYFEKADKLRNVLSCWNYPR